MPCYENVVGEAADELLVALAADLKNGRGAMGYDLFRAFTGAIVDGKADHDEVRSYLFNEKYIAAFRKDGQKVVKVSKKGLEYLSSI